MPGFKHRASLEPAPYRKYCSEWTSSKYISSKHMRARYNSDIAPMSPVDNSSSCHGLTILYERPIKYAQACCHLIDYSRDQS